MASHPSVETPARLCLAEIEQSLRSVQERLAEDGSELAVRRDGEPPFVLSPDNAAEYFAVSTALRSTDRRGPVALLRLPGLRQRVLSLVSRHADARYLQH